MDDEPKSVGDILDVLDEAADGGDTVSIRQMMDAFGERSYGPFLIVPALLELSPLGAIPGVPTFLAVIILLFAVQIALGRTHFWVPDIIGHRSATSGRLKKAVEKMRPLARWMDRWFHGRLKVLVRGPFRRIAAVACVLLAMSVPPLEIVPFASSGPMAAVAMFGLALLVRDGALMIAAMVAAAASVGLMVYLLV
jgi:hypothetical protein